MALKPESEASAEPFDLDAEAFRRLGHAVVDAMADHWAAEPVDPVLPTIDGAGSRALVDEPLPRISTPASEVLAQAAQVLKVCSRKNGHPRFFGYVCASADPVGVLADALASTANQNLTAWRSSPAATEMERLVVRWLDEGLGFDGAGHGVLLSGGTAANVHGITCALARARERADGKDSGSRDLVLYTSTEAHLSIPQAGRAFGLTPSRIRRLPVDGARRLDVEALDRAITGDLEAGLFPACVVASAGTANTGAVDPLLEIAELCRRHDLWFHIDGAYGAPAALAASGAEMREAFGRADSLSVDPHKWLFAPFDVGCSLVRDPRDSHRAFARSSEYIAVDGQGDIESFAFFDHSPELSRRFRALKVWAILKTRGVDGLGREIERQIELRRRLDHRIAAEDELEPLGSGLSISCFRYRPPSLDDEDTLRHLNQGILRRLVDSGTAFMSPTTLEGRFSLRICIVNFRTQEADLDRLLGDVLRLGRRSA